jgi:lipopolysaccharide/colanic/teichoic acid biosynthesis glycosyltransferase
LIVLAPVFLAIAILIKLEDRGPVFYRGARVGRFGVPFKIFKFRSMVLNADELGGASTSDRDSRITKVGRLIRRFKLDEFSQLINVFVGDMSFVGPRPQVQWAVDAYSDEEKKILQLRPGITDWASIKFHNEGEILERSGIADPDEAYLKLIHPEKMRLQLVYLYDHSFWIDMKIIFRTIATLLGDRLIGSNEKAS